MFWLGFGQRTPRGFSPGSFFSGFRFFFTLSLSSSSSPLPPPPFLVAGLGSLSPPSFRLVTGHRTDIRYLYRPGTCFCTCDMSFLSPLSARVGRPPPRFLPPSALFSLSLSLSLSSLSLSLCKHAQQWTWLILPAVIRLFRRLSQACLSVSVSQQGCKWLTNTAMIFAVLHHTWITVENLGLIQATCLTFGEWLLSWATESEQALPCCSGELCWFSWSHSSCWWWTALIL